VNDEERLQEINEVLSELSELAMDRILLVEGPRDKDALNALGIIGRTYMVQSEGGPLKASEFVAENGNKAVILTDWDRKGGTIASDLSRNLSALGAEYDTSIRSRLSMLCKKYIKDVESLDSLVERMTSDISGILRE